MYELLTGCGCLAIDTHLLISLTDTTRFAHNEPLPFIQDCTLVPAPGPSMLKLHSALCDHIQVSLAAIKGHWHSTAQTNIRQVSTIHVVNKALDGRRDQGLFAVTLVVRQVSLVAYMDGSALVWEMTLRSAFAMPLSTYG